MMAVSLSALAEGSKVESVGAYAEPSASESLRKALDQKGSRVILSDGAPYCEIWLRAAIPTGKTEAPGAIYTTFGESALIGVITFTKQTNDFRGQAIKAGSYTLRYALHPTDGNHLGISPVRDFLVLIPVAADQNVDAQYKYDELMKMSMKASGTNHPAVLSLLTPEGKPAAPATKENESGHVVFTTTAKSSGGADLPISFVAKGIAEH
jgi:hypothetical protein